MRRRFVVGLALLVAISVAGLLLAAPLATPRLQRGGHPARFLDQSAELFSTAAAAVLGAPALPPLPPVLPPPPPRAAGVRPSDAWPAVLTRSAASHVARWPGNAPGAKPRPPWRKFLSGTNAMAALYPRASDTWLVSYPKSGQTWLRFLLCNLLAYPSRRPVDFKLIEDRMPFLEDGSAEWISTTFRMQPPPRIWKSHMPFSREQHPCNGELQMSKVQCVCPNCAPRFQRVVYLVRDGRDVMYSCWRFRQVRAC